MIINAIQNCYTATYNSIWGATSRAIGALNKTIQNVRQYNLGLIACSMGLAYFRDYNIVVIYGVIGGIFYKQVKAVEESVNTLFKAFLIIIDPIRNYKICNRRIFYYPLNALLLITGGLAYLYYMPITILLTEAYIATRCGADLISTSRELVAKNLAPRTEGV